MSCSEIVYNKNEIYIIVPLSAHIATMMKSLRLFVISEVLTPSVALLYLTAILGIRFREADINVLKSQLYICRTNTFQLSTCLLIENFFAKERERESRSSENFSASGSGSPVAVSDFNHSRNRALYCFPVDPCRGLTREIINVTLPNGTTIIRNVLLDRNWLVSN